MRPLTHIGVLALATLFLSGRATAADPSPATQADADKAAADTKATMDRQAAAATIPQLNAARGGTLGIATGLQMQGAQASVDDQLLGDQKTTTAFAKVGGLTISQLDIEIFAEVMSQDLPRIVLDGSTVSRDMTLTSVSAAALRLKLNRGGGLRVSKLQNKACLAAFNAQPATRRLKLLQRDATDVPSNVHDACDLDKVNGTFSYAVSAGVRVLRSTPSIRADSNATAAVGGAFELIIKETSTR